MKEREGTYRKRQKMGQGEQGGLIDRESSFLFLSPLLAQVEPLAFLSSFFFLPFLLLFCYLGDSFYIHFGRFLFLLLRIWLLSDTILPFFLLYWLGHNKVQPDRACIERVVSVDTG
jgi:hypothetical protein